MSSELGVGGERNMSEERFDFENLSVYQKSLDYIDFVYGLTSRFPKVEMFRLTQNFQGAAQSIAINIGEGSGGSRKEFRQFIRIARRSVRECVVCTTIARRREYITGEEEMESRRRCIELSEMLSGLHNSV